MIVQPQETGSNKWGQATILVRCDNCGLERYVTEQNLRRRQTGPIGQCHPCYVRSPEAAAVRRGAKHSDEAKAKVGAAAKGRPTSDYKRKRLSETHSGARNRRWNPDREQVTRNTRARKESYMLLEGCLRRIGKKKIGRAEQMLGYTGLELMAHIESLFLPGMSWSHRAAWHIDHIKPVSHFVAEGISDVKIINALSNLQPLWAADNLSKRDRDRLAA